MYGYMNDIDKNLSKQEMTRYRTYYCRICNALALRYGFHYRMLVNYDVVTYMIITKMAVGDTFDCQHYHCQAKHIKGMSDFKTDSLGQFFALLTARGMGVAIQDKLQDEGKKKLKYKFFSLLFKKAMSPRDEKEKALNGKVTARMAELLSLEKETGRDVSLYLDYYAESVLMCIEEYYTLPAPHRELIRQIARFADYMDMLQDYDEDVKEGAFNPLVAGDAPTFYSYLGTHWRDIYAMSYDMSIKMNVALNEIRTEEPSLEWEILAKIVKLVIPKALEKIIKGESNRKTFLPTD